MELDMMEGLFDDFDIITQEEYGILYDCWLGRNCNPWSNQ